MTCKSTHCQELPSCGNCLIVRLRQWSWMDLIQRQHPLLCGECNRCSCSGNFLLAFTELFATTLKLCLLGRSWKMACCHKVTHSTVRLPGRCHFAPLRSLIGWNFSVDGYVLYCTQAKYEAAEYRTVRRQASQCWCWCSFVTMTIEYDSSSNSLFSTRPDGCRTQTSLTHQRPYHPIVYCTCTTNLPLRISKKDWIGPQGRLHDLREREIGFLVTESI